MKWEKLNSRKIVNVNVTPYLIDWDHAVSVPQKRVKDFLRPFWQNSVVLEEVRIPGSLLRIDLMNLPRRIAIEVSPSSSHAYNPFFHKHRFGFGAALNRELDKAEWCRRNGFKHIELTEEDIGKLSPQWFKATHDLDL